MKRISNFAKTWSFTPSTVAHPTSAEELRALVRRANKVRVVGSAHSWSKGIITSDTLVSLDAMKRVLEVRRDELLVTVQAGIKLKELIVELERRGLALANLGSISEQSLAGAVSTATHGSGIGWQCLASQVEALKLIDGNGDERQYRNTDDAFRAAVTGFGCLGIIHEMTMKVVPSFQMHAITDIAKFDDVVDRLEDHVNGNDHFKLWWLVPDDDVIVFLNNRTNAPRNDSDFQRWFKDELLGVLVYRSLLAAEKLHREAIVPRVNQFLLKQVGKRFERTCKSHVGFLTPKPPVHRESEYAFDYANAKQLLREWRRVLSASGHTYNFIQEARFTKADDFWLSPACGRDSIWLSLYNIDSDRNWDDQLAKFEAFALAHGGRPHWGKEAAFDSTYLENQYAKLDEFRALMRSHDPERKFVNEWVAKVLG